MTEEKKETDAEFLRAISNRIDTTLTGEERQRLHEIATFLTPPSADATKQGLNQWEANDWGKRARQTGMEKSHERTVMDLINLLGALEIPFYKFANGEKVGQYTTDERLSQLRVKVVEAYTKASDLNRKNLDLDRQLGDYKVAIAAAEGILTTLTRNRLPVSAAVIDVLALLEGVVPKKDPIQRGEPDRNGITRVTVDARQVVQQLVGFIQHDLKPNEDLCPKCLGLGLVKCEQAYRPGSAPPREGAFVYHHEWLVQCWVCVDGKVTLCPHCKVPIPLGQIGCPCKAAMDEYRAADRAAELERQKALPKIALADYEMPVVWDNDNKGFIALDEDLDAHLAEHPDAVFFAVISTESLTRPEAADIMEAMEESAVFDWDVDDDVLEFSEKATAELDGYLKSWASRHVKAKRLWSPYLELIVEVPRGSGR